VKFVIIAALVASTIPRWVVGISEDAVIMILLWSYSGTTFTGLRNGAQKEAPRRRSGIKRLSKKSDGIHFTLVLNLLSKFRGIEIFLEVVPPLWFWDGPIDWISGVGVRYC
jgi:hypothetical protein